MTHSPDLQASHVSVLPQEVLTALNPQPGQVVVDATVGGGGHTRLLADRVSPGGRVIGLDQDAGMLERARGNLGQLPVTLVQANFEAIRSVLDGLQISSVDGVLADLGFCSDQLEDPARGLSFRREGPLDMRLDRDRGEPVGDLIQRLEEKELADLIYQFGEERLSRRIARKIVEVRAVQPLQTTTELADLVRSCVPRSRHPGAIDPATRVFQALRIAVNDELGALDRLLEELPRCVRLGGRVAIISFHSLEDRRVKQAFRNRALWQEMTKKPVMAQEEEINQNPRSRSAKLRCAIRGEGQPGKINKYAGMTNRDEEE